MFISYLKNWFFIDKRIYIINRIYFDRSKLNIFALKPSEFKIYISVESDDEKTAENHQNFYVAENAKIATKCVSKWHVPLFYTFPEISRQRAFCMGRVSSFWM